MYFATIARPGRVHRAAIDGLDVQTITSNWVEGRRFAVDQAAGQLYLSTWGERRVARLNLDGTGTVTTVIGNTDQPMDIALDLDRAHVYLAAGAGTIQRANLDGSDVRVLLSGLGNVVGLALDLQQGKMYWTDVAGGLIQRANLDGSSVETVLSGLNDPRDLELDPTHGLPYWIRGEGGSIHRATLDGMRSEVLVSDLVQSNGLALDASGGTIYFTEVGGRVQRVSTDGSQQAVLIQALVQPRGIAVVQAPAAR